MRRWWPDAVLALVAGGYGVASVLLGAPFAAQDRPASMVLSVAAGLALGLVRRWPWPVLATEAALLVLSDSVTPYNTDTAQWTAALALGVVAYRTGWASTVAGFAVGLAATLVNVVDPGNLGVLRGFPGVVRVCAIVGVAAAPVAFGRYLRGVRQAAEVARERVREAEAMQEVRTRAARLAERTALARDLHDILAHHVGALALQSGAALYAVRRTGRTEDAVEALGTARDTAVRVLDELRALLEVLRDPDAVADGEPEPSAVEPERMIGEAVGRVRAAGLRVADDIATDVAGAPLVLRTTAARVVQEGLTNSLKHAGPGASARVRVALDAGEVRVLVADDGPPGRPPALPSSGHGLTGLRERVALLGGTLTAGPSGRGWQLLARLPIREAAT